MLFYSTFRRLQHKEWQRIHVETLQHAVKIKVQHDGVKCVFSRKENPIKTNANIKVYFTTLHKSRMNKYTDLVLTGKQIKEQELIKIIYYSQKCPMKCVLRTLAGS